jgi:hypothetical protein
MENQIKYLVKSIHDIFEDSYTNGEGKQVNSYQMEDQIWAISPAQAIEKYSSKILGFDLDFENMETNSCDGSFWASFLVDKENFQASIEDVEKWKKGEILLYSNNIDFNIYELNQILTL